MLRSKRTWTMLCVWGRKKTRTRTRRTKWSKAKNERIASNNRAVAMFDTQYRSSEVLVVHLRDYMNIRGIDNKIRFAPKAKKST